MSLVMELLRNLRVTTRLLFLFEVTTTRHTRLRTIAERLGMTVQGVSEYANGLQVDGLLVLADGEYRATKKGVELLHDQFVSLREFVDRSGRALDLAGVVAAKDLGLKPRIEFAVLAATVEAAERGVDVLLLVPEERVAEAVQAIEAANARLEDKIPYETVALG